MTAAEHGLVSSATVFGILVGAIALGGLADYFGRKLLFIGEMIIFVFFLVLLTASPSLPWLIVFLFGIGLALGCDYPTAHLLISESTPSNLRGRLVLSAFGFQALGVLLGTAVGYVVLHNIPDIGAWRWMYATAIIPALLVTIGRFFVLESASWQLSRGRIEEAEQTTAPVAPAALSAQCQTESRPLAPFAPWPAFRPFGFSSPEQPAGDDPGSGALVPAGSLHYGIASSPRHPHRLSGMSPSMPAISPISSTTCRGQGRGLH